MTNRKGIEHILDYFGDPKIVTVIGSLCFAYFIIHWLPETQFIMKILPPMPGWIYTAISISVIVYQVITWRFFKLFRKESIKMLRPWFLFFCEFWLLFFSAGFLCWPFYFLSTFIKT